LQAISFKGAVSDFWESLLNKLLSLHLNQQHVY